MRIELFQRMSATERKVRSREDDNYSNWAIISYGVCKGLYDIFCLLQMIKPLFAHLKDCYFLSLKFFKNVDYRYCLLTT